MVKDSNAYKFAMSLLEEMLQSMKQPKPRPVQEVAQMLDARLQTGKPCKDDKEEDAVLHNQIQKMLDPIQPYIYGSTPMCASLKNTEVIFQRITNSEEKILFILSDGNASDGDPVPIAEALKESGVTVVTCFLTPESIENGRQLFDPKTEFYNTGKNNLFKMSSIMNNCHTPVSYLTDAGWELPPCGESRLFVQANSLEVVNEFCKLVVSQIRNRCDALVHLLHKVPLAMYVNQEIESFKPKKQFKGACYANAIAAVFHLAMLRIEGREGGVPAFDKIRLDLKNAFGQYGAKTRQVLKKVCSIYRLRFREVDERGARQAINERRPVVARYQWYGEQREKFIKFYENSGKGILEKSDIAGLYYTNIACTSTISFTVHVLLLVLLKENSHCWLRLDVCCIKNDLFLIQLTHRLLMYWEVMLWC